jgi:hypothetical protein
LDGVAAALGQYIIGSHAFILDIPPAAQALHHVGVMVERAQQEVFA